MKKKVNGTNKWQRECDVMSWIVRRSITELDGGGWWTQLDPRACAKAISSSAAKRVLPRLEASCVSVGLLVLRPRVKATLFQAPAQASRGGFNFCGQCNSLSVLSYVLHSPNSSSCISRLCRSVCARGMPTTASK